jgi:soluble P-type ATPase
VIAVEWPDGSRWTLRHLCLDLNGTLALDGALLPGVAGALLDLAQDLELHLLTAGTHGGLPAVEQALGVRAVPIGLGAEKEAYVAQLGAETCVAIGNGRNDAAMLRRARLGVAVLGPEGLAAETAQAADVVVGDILTGLALLRHPLRLTATLRP